MIASPDRDVQTPPLGPGRAQETVVPLYNEQDLARSLAPWAQLARRQRWVKARLVLTDLSVLWCCFVAGRLPAWFRDEVSLSQAMNIWWAAQGQLRLTLFATIALAMVGWMWAVQGHYTAQRRKPWWDEARQILHVVIVAALIDAMVLYLAKWPLSRLWTGVTWGLVLIFLPLARLAIRSRLLRAGLLTQPYVLIGHPDDVEKAAAALASEPLLGYKPVAVVSPNPGERLVSLGKEGVFAPTALTPAARVPRQTRALPAGGRLGHPRQQLAARTLARAHAHPRRPRHGPRGRRPAHVRHGGLIPV